VGLAETFADRECDSDADRDLVSDGDSDSVLEHPVHRPNTVSRSRFTALRYLGACGLLASMPHCA
jgi:hypothetical protein